MKCIPSGKSLLSNCDHMLDLTRLTRAKITMKAQTKLYICITPYFDWSTARKGICGATYFIWPNNTPLLLTAQPWQRHKSEGAAPAEGWEGARLRGLSYGPITFNMTFQYLSSQALLRRRQLSHLSTSQDSQPLTPRPRTHSIPLLYLYPLS